jgi:hypothetical protein
MIQTKLLIPQIRKLRPKEERLAQSQGELVAKLEYSPDL